MRLKLALALLALAALGAASARSQAQDKPSVSAVAGAAADSGFGPLDPAPPAGDPADIIKKIAARESDFDSARRDYGFRQSVKVQTLDDDNRPDGEYRQTTDISFTADGHRQESVTFAPANTLTRVLLSQQDMTDIERRLPFVLTTADLPDYDIRYLGRQKVDELDTYVFQSSPIQIVKGKRYFQGKLWVDQQDLQIVLIDGRLVPDDLRRGKEDLSLPFATYYEQVDGDYWFPTYTKCEGILNFPAQNGSLGQSVHMREVITYSNYKRFRSKSRIFFNGQQIPQQPANGQPPQPTTEPPPVEPR